MSKTVVALCLSLFILCGGLSAATSHKRTSKRRPAVALKPVHTSKAVSKKSAGVKSASHSTHAKRAPVTPTRYTQQVPTPERYREIQQALAAKGYLEGPVTGQWGPDSITALKRFQTDQNLAVSGKLDAVSLIALGLGPKRDLSARSTTESRPKDENRRPEGSERP